jgi:hypothetical protein
MFTVLRMDSCDVEGTAMFNDTALVAVVMTSSSTRVSVAVCATLPSEAMAIPRLHMR